MALRIGVVGAGVSGLAFVHRLVEIANFSFPLEVKVLEWGRGPGGRLARKRVQVPSKFKEEKTTLFFDHGCPLFALSDEALIKLLSGDRAQRAGMQQCVEPIQGTRNGFVGVPESNNAVVKGFIHAIEQLQNNGPIKENRCVESDTSDASQTRICHEAIRTVEYLYQRHVLKAEREDGKQWSLMCLNRGTEMEERHDFDVLVLTDKLLFLETNTYKILSLDAVLPEPHVNHLTKRILHRKSEPRIVLMVAIRVSLDMLEQMKASLEVRSICKDDQVCSFIVHETGKPTRAAFGENSEALAQFVVHSTLQYAHLNMVFDEATGEGHVKSEREEIVLDELFDSCRRHINVAVFGNSLDSECSNHSLFGDVAFRQLFVWDHAVVHRKQEDNVSSGPAENSEHNGLDASFFNGDLGFGLVGDYWFLPGVASDVETSLLSGRQLAENIVQFHSRI